MDRQDAMGALGTVLLVLLTGVFIVFVVLAPLGVVPTPRRWWLLAAIPVGVAVDRLLLWAEGRGLVYWRRRSASSTGLGSAMLTVQAIFEPEKAHVVEERRRVDVDEAEDDDPLDP